MEEQNLEKIQKHEAEALERDGFYIHYVMEETANSHTHGLTESFGHPEIEINLSIHPDSVLVIMHKVVDLIKSGQSFSHGHVLESFFEDKFDAMFYSSPHGLRLIICDSTGCLNPNHMEEAYRIQFQGLRNQLH